MGFLDRLRAQSAPPQEMMNTSRMMPLQYGTSNNGGSDISGILSSIEPFINRMRNRDLDDLRASNAIMNPSIRPDRLRQVFDPNMQQQEQPQNVVFQPSMTDFQRAQLGLQERQLGQAGHLESRKLDQSERFGQEKLGIQGAAQELNELKNEQIYDTKLKEIQRKSEEAENRLKFAERQLQSNENNLMAQDQFKRAQMDAINARHSLDLAQKDSQFAATNDVAQKKLAAYVKAIEDAGYLIQEDELSTDPTTGAQKRIRITKKGEPTKPVDKKNDPAEIRK